MKVLLVEDEKKLAKAVKFLFKEQKIDCDAVFDGKEGYETALGGNYDVIVLDVMLPNMDGFEILSSLRRDGVNTPIIMLTAKQMTSDKVKGLNLGADDYLIKPFDSDELIARVNALSRRSGVVVMDEMTFGDLTLDADSGDLKRGEESVKLNFKEKEILRLFFASRGAVVSTDALIDKVWGYDSDATDNNVKAYVSFIRKKIAFLGSGVTIKNYQKVGYKIEAEDDKEA